MKRLQRTHVLSAKGDTLYEATPGGKRKIRCTRCNQNYAVETRNSAGKLTLQCPCGAQYGLTRM